VIKGTVPLIIFILHNFCITPNDMPVSPLHQTTQTEDHLAIVILIFENVLTVDSPEHHVIDTRPAFLSTVSWHIIRHRLSLAKITIPFHFTKAFAEK
jgi:hypothetical protein